MSRSKHAVELCALLVDETYGELTSVRLAADVNAIGKGNIIRRIFTILLRRGRLPISALAKHTRLTPRQLRHGLVVLVQQGLVYHNLEGDTTMYEANHDTAYGLARSGKIIEAVQSRYGNAAKDVVQTLLLLGHTKVLDLERHYNSKIMDITNGNGYANGLDDAEDRGPTAAEVNGPPDDTPAITGGRLHAILIRLLEARIIQPVVKSMLRSPTDTYDMVEKKVLRESFGGNTKGGKQKEEMNILIQREMRAIRDEGQDWQTKVRKGRPANGNHMNGTNGSTKRRRLSIGGASVAGDQYEDDGARLDADMTLRINYERCLVMLRGQEIVSLAKFRIGETTSVIYGAALRLIEEKIPRCQPDPMMDQLDEGDDGPSFTTNEVASSISRSIDVTKGLGKESDPSQDRAGGSPTATRRKHNVDESEDENMANGHGHDSDDNEDIKPRGTKRNRVTFQDQAPAHVSYVSSDDMQNRTAYVKKHLLLLASDDCKFITKLTADGNGKWSINFQKVIEFMREAEMDTMVLDNFGAQGHRLTRMMRTLGKLDEKQMVNLALLTRRDILTKLAQMQMAGIVDIQEVPRDTGRTTARTIFLWYFDTERVSNRLLDSVYKCMSRCYQRLEVEKRRARDFIIPTERTDVQHLPLEEYLEQTTINGFLAFKATEEKIFGEISRLDELIGIFRDY